MQDKLPIFSVLQPTRRRWRFLTHKQGNVTDRHTVTQHYHVSISIGEGDGLPLVVLPCEILEDFLWQPVNKPINQPCNQSLNQPTNQLANQSFNSLNQSANNQAAKQPSNQPFACATLQVACHHTFIRWRILIQWGETFVYGLPLLLIILRTSAPHIIDRDRVILYSQVALQAHIM